jgi:bifunctional hydroxylase/dehydrase
VRRHAGIGFPGHDAEIEMSFAEISGCAVRPRPNGERVPGGMVLAFAQGGDVARVTCFERSAVPAKDDRMPSFAQVADTWQRLTGEDIHAATPRWVGRFTDASRQASSYRRGPVFLAGDAAHIHLPIGGQGMSTGVQDAVNLGWKLAAQIHGHAPPGLLDSYHDERHPVGARVVTNTLAQRILYTGDADMAPMRDLFAELAAFADVRRHLIGMVTGLDIRYDVGPGDHPLLGRRLPPCALRPAGRREPVPGSTAALLHAGRGVLLDLAADTAMARVARPWADRVDVVAARACPTGAEAAAAWAGVGAVLVRPDGYCAWVGAPGAAGTDLEAALARWFGPPALRAAA